MLVRVAAWCQLLWCVAALAEQVVVFWQCGQQQGQAAWSRMMLEHGAIDGAEEPLGLGVDRIAFRVAGAMSSHRAGFDPAMRTRGTVALLLAFDNLIQAAWHLQLGRASCRERGCQYG